MFMTYQADLPFLGPPLCFSLPTSSVKRASTGPHPIEKGRGGPTCCGCLPLAGAGFDLLSLGEFVVVVRVHRRGWTLVVGRGVGAV
jgi:hypothetical protein